MSSSTAAGPPPLARRPRAPPWSRCWGTLPTRLTGRNWWPPPSGRTGRLDLLVNNASALGPSPLPPFRGHDLAVLRQLFETNVIAPLALVQLALPLLAASGGAVLNITSDAAVEAYEGWGGYGSSKAALDQLGNVLAVEEPNVRVWSLDPGDMRTGMHQAAFPGQDISDRPLPETVVPAILALIGGHPPSGRVRAADFARAATP